MTPAQYEAAVSDYFRNLGYAVKLTPRSNDFGVDVFAEKGREKLAIQAKLYGNSRRVNREMVMQLQGAKTYFDCTKAVLATDGELIRDAIEVAEKLGIQILRLPSAGLPHELNTQGTVGFRDTQFEDVWRKHIMPLQGKTVTGPTGLTNKIVRVDWTGAERITSNGEKHFLPIEVFRRSIEHIFEYGSITRSQINDDYPKRGSSGVVLILSQVPLFKCTTHPLQIHMQRG